MGASDDQVAWVSSPVPLRQHLQISRASSARPSAGTFAQSPNLNRRVVTTAAVMETGDKSPATTPQSLPDWDGSAISADFMLQKVKFNEAGLVPAIAQQWDTGEVLMMAWMNAESIRQTMSGGRAVYYSRSRKELWRKGDTSGQIQVLKDLILDCDGDTVLLMVEQLGVACHTGRRSCFYTAFRPPGGEGKVVAEVLMDPKELYKSG